MPWEREVPCECDVPCRHEVPWGWSVGCESDPPAVLAWAVEAMCLAAPPVEFLATCLVCAIGGGILWVRGEVKGCGGRGWEGGFLGQVQK